MKARSATSLPGSVGEGPENLRAESEGAFVGGQGLTEHTSPFDALVMVLEGSLTLTIGGTPVRATPGTVVRMPAGVPHALDAPDACRMLLIMLRDLTVP